MLLQFEQARAFLRQVIEKGRHLHDSDGEGLSEDEPGGFCVSALPPSIRRSLRFQALRKAGPCGGVYDSSQLGWGEASRLVLSASAMRRAWRGLRRRMASLGKEALPRTSL